jgi:hypothetical protein
MRSLYLYFDSKSAPACAIYTQGSVLISYAFALSRRIGIISKTLDKHYPGKWIDRGGAITWPPRSPVLTPLHFPLWDFVKVAVYVPLMSNIVEPYSKWTKAHTWQDFDRTGILSGHLPRYESSTHRSWVRIRLFGAFLIPTINKSRDLSIHCIFSV